VLCYLDHNLGSEISAISGKTMRGEANESIHVRNYTQEYSEYPDLPTQNGGYSVGTSFNTSNLEESSEQTPLAAAVKSLCMDLPQARDGFAMPLPVIRKLRL
jgi:hypothetical protein